MYTKNIIFNRATAFERVNNSFLDDDLLMIYVNLLQIWRQSAAPAQTALAFTELTHLSLALTMRTVSTHLLDGWCIQPACTTIIGMTPWRAAHPNTHCTTLRHLSSPSLFWHIASCNGVTHLIVVRQIGRGGWIGTSQSSLAAGLCVWIRCVWNQWLIISSKISSIRQDKYIHL